MMSRFTLVVLGVLSLAAQGCSGGGSKDLKRAEEIVAWVDHALPQTGKLGRMRNYAALGYPPNLMLNDAAHGAAFQCDDRSRTFIWRAKQLGYRARFVNLRAANGDGHGMAEIYLPDMGRWVIFGLLQDQYYLVNGRPAGALTLMRASRDTTIHVRGSKGLPFSGVARYFNTRLHAVVRSLDDDPFLRRPLQPIGRSADGRYDMFISADSSECIWDRIRHKWSIWPR